MMKRWHTIIIFCVLFALTGVYAAVISPTIVWGQDGTIPTRTPTPGAGQPTATRSSPTNTPPTSSAPTNTPASAATATSVTSSTATATATATAVSTTITPTSTTVGEFPFPEADECGDPPTITTLVIVNVYAGPGSDYPVVETLAKNEIRPIIGRAQYAEWWLILLDETGEEAWINNKAGVVIGYTGNVSIMTAPEIDGETPTPGTPWNPTPVPHCTVTPTATPTATATATETATQTATPTVDAETSGATTSTTSSTQTKSSEAATASDGTDSSNADATESNTVSGIGNSPQTSNKNADTGETAPSEPTAVPLEATSSSSNLNNILPIVGLVLVAGAIFVILFLRRGRGGTATPTDE